MMLKKSGPQKETRSAMHRAAPYLNIGYTLTGGIILFGYLGNLLDQKTGRAPLFLITGLFTGLALGFYNMIKVLNQLNRKDK